MVDLSVVMMSGKNLKRRVYSYNSIDYSMKP